MEKYEEQQPDEVSSQVERVRRIKRKKRLDRYNDALSKLGLNDQIKIVSRKRSAEVKKVMVSADAPPGLLARFANLYGNADLDLSPYEKGRLLTYSVDPEKGEQFLREAMEGGDLRAVPELAKIDNAKSPRKKSGAVIRSELNSAVKNGLDNSEVHKRIGINSANLGLNDEAEDNLRAAVLKTPIDADKMYIRSLICAVQGDDVLSGELLREAADLGHLEALELLLKIPPYQLNWGHRTQALHWGDFRLLPYFAQCALNEGETDAAIELLKKAVEVGDLRELPQLLDLVEERENQKSDGSK